MNQRLRIALAGLWLCLLSSPLLAQPGFYLPFANNATPNGLINMPIKVVRFDSVITAQFVLRWDPAVLEFLFVDQLNLPELVIENFNTSQALDSGIMRFAWVASDFDAGVSLPDSSTIFRLRFRILGEIGDTSNVEITEISPNTIFEIGTASGDIYLLDSVEITSGFVAVGFTVETGEPGFDPFEARVFPNPFVDRIHLTFQIQNAGPVDVLLTDAQGKILYEENTYFTVGKHGMEIAYPSMQMYTGPIFLLLRCAGEVSVHPLVKH
ncbi:MAG: hypothetical protein IT270_15680 [Saprospiraceae bacterium]|nr:hypothetical protein [Saprospiraceae bacterium]